MKIKTLKGTGVNKILKVFNESFSDYFISFQLTEEQLTSKMLADKVNLNLSVGVFEKGKLIAFILHGVAIMDSQKLVYNGGTGVIREKRGIGLTKKMYAFILPILTEEGFDKIILEVITENFQAIKSYKKSGFKTKRTLVCYKGTVTITDSNQTIKVSRLKTYDWNLMKSFWEVHPTWQNSSQVLNESKNNDVALGAYIDKQLVGYVIYSPMNKRIRQIAVSNNFRKEKMASTLILKLKEAYDNEFSIINVGKHSKSLNTFFNKIGLERTLEQYEMELELLKNFHRNQS